MDARLRYARPRRWLTATTVALLVASTACADEAGAPDAPPPTMPASATAASPAPTEPLRTPAVPDGWQVFESNAISIAAPPSYVGGDPALDETIAAMRALGANCIAAAGLIEQFRAEYLYAALDADTCATTSVRTVQVLAARSSARIPSAFAEEFVAGLGDRGSLLDLKVDAIGGQPAAFMEIRREFDTLVTVQAVYAVRTGLAWHIVAGAASEADFTAAAPTFDAIAATFRAR